MVQFNRPYSFSPLQWRSQVIGIGQAPAVRLTIALTTLSACVHMSGTNFGWARARPDLAFTTPLPSCNTEREEGGHVKEETEREEGGHEKEEANKGITQKRKDKKKECGKGEMV